MPSIAIIGASANREKFSNKCVRVYQKLGWRVFPVNPKETQIEGLACFASVKGLPQVPGRVSIYLPAQVTISLIDDFVFSGIKEVILNPGAESDELVLALKNAGIAPVLVCSIRLEGEDPSKY